MNRRHFLTLTTAAAAALAHEGPALPRRKPLPQMRSSGSGGPSTFSKILLVMCDQWRTRQHWPGAPRIPLPAYGRLCQHGMEFAHCFVATTACTPSRATLFSGKYGKETGAQLTSGLHVVFHEREAYLGASPDNPRCQLPRTVKTLGHHFREAGIPAYYKGKWHLSHADGQWPKGPAEGLESYGFSAWNPPEGHGKDAWRLGYGLDSNYVQDTVRLLWDLKNRNESRWFVVCSLINPHDIGAFPKWLPDIPDMGVTLPPNFADDLADKPACQGDFRRVWVDGTLAGRALANARYRREKSSRDQLWHEYLQLYPFLVQWADSQVGIVLDALEQTGQQEETLVVFLSDHGEQGGAHGMMQKWYQAYEESIRVPLVFSNPRLFPQGRRVEAMASLIDVAPTLLALAGVEPPTGSHQLRGHDLSPIIHSQQAEVQEDVLFISDDDIAAVAPYRQWTGPVRQPNRVRCVRNRLWKYVQYIDPEGRSEPFHELYDLTQDPYERKNLARDPGHKPTLEAMKTRLGQLLAERYDLPKLYS